MSDDDPFLDLLFDRAVQACADGQRLDLDAALAGREHLRAQAQRIVAMAREVATVSSPESHSPAQPIPGYSRLREVGRGGMGIVYRARQDSLGRDVALKVLAPALVASPRLRERFALEARVLGRLRHPHVVAVHDIVVSEGVCAYAMEWLEGESLASRIAAMRASGASPDCGAVARLGELLARALHAVHAAGLVHRDVKPSNVLLRADGSPVLTDFGLVRDDAESMHTRTGEFLGTAAYAAPEQLRGAHDQVGAWTDVYGLGVTLYTALAGDTPFASTSTAALLRRIEEGVAVPLGRRSPTVPRDLATIVGKAIDKDPQRRYRSANDLADDLARFLAYQPILARPAGLALRAQRWIERSPTLALSLAALVVTLALGLGVSSWLAIDLAAQRTAARSAEAKAIAEADVQRGITDFMREVFRGGDASAARGRADMTVLQAVDQSARVILTERGVGGVPAVQCAIHTAVGEIYLNMGKLEQADVHLQRAHELCLAVHGREGRQYLELATLLGRLHRARGKLEDAELALRDIVRLRRAEQHDFERFAYLGQALSSWGITLRQLGRHAEAEAAYVEALAAYRRQFGKDEENVAAVLSSLSMAQSAQGRHQEALANSARALEVLAAHYAGQPHLDIAIATFNRGILLWAAGARDESIAQLRRGHDATIALVTIKHGRAVAQARQFAQRLIEHGDPSAAESLLRDAVAAAVELKDPTRATACCELAELLLARARFAEADAAIEGAVADDNQATRVRALRARGRAQAGLGQHAGAAASLDAAWQAVPATDLGGRRAVAAAQVELHEAWHAAAPAPERAAALALWRQRRDELAADGGKQ